MTAPPADDGIQTETLALARELIRRPSLTPDDGGCLDLVSARLAACGFHIERIDRGGVRNLWARRGDAAPLVCFAGHVDVVPTGPEAAWTALARSTSGVQKVVRIFDLISEEELKKLLPQQPQPTPGTATPRA
jgi:hypothetical protein